MKPIWISIVKRKERVKKAKIFQIAVFVFIVVHNYADVKLQNAVRKEDTFSITGKWS